MELDGSNNITARYTHGPGIDEPLIMEKGGASFFYHADGLGSITEITDSVGAVKQRYIYSSFGKIESQLDPNFIQPYTFTGREFDLETGLYFYRARYYDPSIGRFLNEDPVNFNIVQRFLQFARSVTTLPAGPENILKELLSRPMSSNLFIYSVNNPINFTDPLGLQVRNIFDAIGKLTNSVCDGLRSRGCSNAGQACSAVVLALSTTVVVTGAIVLGTAAIFPVVALELIGPSAIVGFTTATLAAIPTAITAAEAVFPP